jgi:ribosomal-protein-alanine N-acetyltransferase
MKAESIIAGSGPIRVRRMTADDADRVMALAAGLPHTPHWSREVYLGLTDAKAAVPRIALVAELPASGELAGIVVASLAPPEAELETIAVAAPFQRRGIARQLIDAVEIHLRAAQVSWVTLEVRVSNLAAQALYRAIGFEEVGWRPGYYAEPLEDAILMRWTLGPPDARRS